MAEPILDKLTSIEQIRTLDYGQLRQLAGELRDEIIATVSKTGGHLASSLGVVELTIALHKVFETPKDKLVWDVGHQAYAHKLLTGRRADFTTLRQLDGVSGFPKRGESEFDCFDVGHSSTSISAALGMAAARDACSGDEKVVAIIGDGSLTAGLAFEGLNHAGHLGRDMIVILNDNEMSISPNVGAVSSFLSRKLSSELFVRFKRETENFLSHVPGIGKDLLQFAQRVEESVKGFLTPGMLFEGFGFDYYGPIDGHNLEDLVETLMNVSRLKGPVLVHVATKKGRGYPPAESNPSLFHGVGPFDRENGKVLEGKGGSESYTGVFGDTLVELAEKDERIVAITAAMKEGTGLKSFAERFPERFFDVGIAEQHAVTFAAGMACRNLRPVVAIYSTFLQRAYDNVLHDVCLQNLPVIFALDRGGLVGADGPTHHGVFDLSYLRHIPNLTLAVPRDENQLRRLMLTATQHDGPFAFRYPRGNAEGVNCENPLEPLPIGKGEKLREGRDGVLIGVGVGLQTALGVAEKLAEEGLEFTVLDARYVKPLDEQLLLAELADDKPLVSFEENALQGGFGSAVLEFCSERAMRPRHLQIGIPDRFIEQGSQAQLRRLLAIDIDGAADRIRNFL